MTNERLFTALVAGPSPSAKRGDGIRDARAGKPRLSSDGDYLTGYELGRRLSGGGEWSDRAGRPTDARGE